jgi:hypothetical protein
MAESYRYASAASKLIHPSPSNNRPDINCHGSSRSCTGRSQRRTGAGMKVSLVDDATVASWMRAGKHRHTDFLLTVS